MSPSSGTKWHLTAFPEHGKGYLMTHGLANLTCVVACTLNTFLLVLINKKWFQPGPLVFKTVFSKTLIWSFWVWVQSGQHSGTLSQEQKQNKTKKWHQIDSKITVGWRWSQFVLAQPVGSPGFNPNAVYNRMSEHGPRKKSCEVSESSWKNSKKQESVTSVSSKHGIVLALGFRASLQVQQTGACARDSLPQLATATWA